MYTCTLKAFNIIIQQDFSNGAHTIEPFAAKSICALTKNPVICTYLFSLIHDENVIFFYTSFQLHNSETSEKIKFSVKIKCIV